jgi:hypothetical protein
LECAFGVVGEILMRGFNVTLGPTAQATLVLMKREKK